MTTLLARLRQSSLLRWPVLAFYRMVFAPLDGGPSIIRRAMYDAMPTRHLVVGSKELYIISTEDKVIGKRLFLDGEFDLEKLNTALGILVREGCPAPRHLIDVGANVGSIAIPAVARGLVESASVIEPHPKNLRLLRANIAINCLSESISIHEVAAADQSFSMLFLEESATNHGNHTIATGGIPVVGMRLDDLDLPTSESLLWMDIEGYEGHALAGATGMLQSRVPVVAEFNPEFLGRSGGLKRFAECLQGRKIFDLGAPEDATTLDQIAAQYSSGFTDILAI